MSHSDMALDAENAAATLSELRWVWKENDKLKEQLAESIEDHRVTLINMKRLILAVKGVDKARPETDRPAAETKAWEGVQKALDLLMGIRG